MKFLRVTLHEPPEIRHPVQEFIAEGSAVDREEMWAWTMADGELGVAESTASDLLRRAEASVMRRATTE